MPACTCATVTLDKCRKVMVLVTLEFFFSVLTRLFSSGPAPFCFFFHAAEARRERAFRTSPQQTGLKIMTLWLCLSFAALCLPLRNSSLNTHMHQSLGAALVCLSVCFSACLCVSSIIFLKYPKAVLIPTLPLQVYMYCIYIYTFFHLSGNCLERP